MNKELATLGIKIEDFTKIPEVNTLLHQFSDCIICRMGMPYEKLGIRLIHVVMDTPSDDVEHLVEQLNAIKGVSSQTMFF